MLTRRSFFSGALQARAAARPLRMGFVGVGGRGSYHLDTCLGLGVQVKAVCDINPYYLHRAKRYVLEAGQPAPALYNGPEDWRRLCERDDLDFIMTATPWHYHTPICVAAMNAGKHCATEVPAALTLDECWQLVETSEKTGKHCMMLEQVNYIRELLRVLNMVQKGVFGEPLHAAGGYVHDLRLVKSDPTREPWRMQYEFLHNCNLYPTHPIGSICWWLNVNHGDRFDSLVSMSSKSTTIKEYTRIYYGERHPYMQKQFTQGDVNTTLLTTAGGKTVTLHYDTNTPHPHTSEFRLQGTKGVWVMDANRIYIEGRTAKRNEWEPFRTDSYDEFDHPLWVAEQKRTYKEARGHGGGSDTAVMWERYFNAIAAGTQPDMTVYDAATYSAIVPLSGQSVAGNGKSIDFPDFTRGKWKTAGPVELR